MLVIPAIDLKDGQCVRLKQGRMEDSTNYGDDPLAMAALVIAASDGLQTQWLLDDTVDIADSLRLLERILEP